MHKLSTAMLLECDSLTCNFWIIVVIHRSFPVVLSLHILADRAMASIVTACLVYKLKHPDSHRAKLVSQ